MKTVITYGTYDLLHEGHIRLLKRAKALGDYLIVGVTSDVFDHDRGKMNVKQSLAERIEGVKKTGLADQIIVEEYEGQKIADILKYNVDVFTVGSDWVGKFDYLREYCEVVYLERTQGISSTELRNKEHAIIKLGLVGLGVPTDRFCEEIRFVNGIEVSGVYADGDKLEDYYCEQYGYTKFTSYDEVLENSDAIYIASDRTQNYNLILHAVKKGKHVLCESPIFLSGKDAKHIFELADSKRVVVMEALKTLYLPAFERLLLLINSGIIGEIKDIDVNCSQFLESLDFSDESQGSIYDFGSYALLPILKMLGDDVKESQYYVYSKGSFSVFTKGELAYKNATATFRVGKGIKTEGDMVITGTEGYVYVPAPWWKIDYFEVRSEDLRKTRKFFYQYKGEGLRYEIHEFVQKINKGIENQQEDIIVASQMLEDIILHSQKI